MKGQPRKRPGIALVAVGALSLVALSVALGAAVWPSSPVAVRSGDPLARALRLVDEGKVGEAQKLFAEELNRDPRSATALRGSAVCARDSGDDEACLQYLQRLTAVSAKDPWAHRQLALALHRLGRDQEALAEVQTLMALEPGDPSTSQLMTKLVMSQSRADDPMSRFPNPMIPGVRNPRGPFPGVPRPEPPDPLKTSPKAPQ